MIAIYTFVHRRTFIVTTYVLPTHVGFNWIPTTDLNITKRETNHYLCSILYIVGICIFLTSDWSLVLEKNRWVYSRVHEAALIFFFNNSNHSTTQGRWLKYIN